MRSVPALSAREKEVLFAGNNHFLPSQVAPRHAEGVSLKDARDFQGTLADAQAFYAQAQTQYQTSLKGVYEHEGRKYTPPAPDLAREEVVYWANQILRLKALQPAAPDVGLIQASFDGGPTLTRSRQFPA